MKKEYILTFAISFIVIVSVFIILLMLMLPQQVQVLEGNINKYDAISKSKYTFQSTKDITNESLTRQYTITDADMNTFKNNRQYTAGNSDPFSPIATEGENSDNTTSNSQTSNSTTSTQDKITNSNGGVANPPSTNK